MSAHAAFEQRYGRAVENGDGLLHIERGPGVTYCGEEFDAYTLHWDTRTVVACGPCLMEAGVPLAVSAPAAPEKLPKV